MWNDDQDRYLPGQKGEKGQDQFNGFFHVLSPVMIHESCHKLPATQSFQPVADLLAPPLTDEESPLAVF